MPTEDKVSLLGLHPAINEVWKIVERLDRKETRSFFQMTVDENAHRQLEMMIRSHGQRLIALERIPGALETIGDRFDHRNASLRRQLENLVGDVDERVSAQIRLLGEQLTQNGIVTTKIAERVNALESSPIESLAAHFAEHAELMARVELLESHDRQHEHVLNDLITACRVQLAEMGARRGPVQHDHSAFAHLIEKETNEAKAYLDAKDRAIDEYGYGQDSQPTTHHRADARERKTMPLPNVMKISLAHYLGCSGTHDGPCLDGSGNLRTPQYPPLEGQVLKLEASAREISRLHNIRASLVEANRQHKKDKETLRDEIRKLQAMYITDSAAVALHPFMKGSDRTVRGQAEHIEELRAEMRRLVEANSAALERKDAEWEDRRREGSEQVRKLVEDNAYLRAENHRMTEELKDHIVIKSDSPIEIPPDFERGWIAGNARGMSTIVEEMESLREQLRVADADRVPLAMDLEIRTEERDLERAWRKTAEPIVKEAIVFCGRYPGTAAASALELANAIEAHEQAQSTAANKEDPEPPDLAF